MKAQVTFETDFFKPEPGEEEQVNSGRFGRALAIWLQHQLSERGVSVEEVLPEDFGWVVMISRKPFMLWLACGNIQESTNLWSIFPVVEVPALRRLFRNPDTAEAEAALWQHVKALIPAIPGVRNITWE